MKILADRLRVLLILVPFLLAAIQLLSFFARTVSIMSTFFNKSAPPKAEDHSASRASSEGQSKEQNSNFVNEPGNTSAENPSTAPGVNDSYKEATGQDSSEAVPNEDSNKESVSSGKMSQENAQEGEQSGSDESDAEKKENDDVEYPSGWRLLFITIALCLCVFCTALVSCLRQLSRKLQWLTSYSG